MLDVLAQLYGEVHPHIATTLRNRAILQKQSGNMAESEALFREALAMHIELQGEDHLEVARSRSLLAEALIQTGQFPEAESLLLAARARFEADGETAWTQRAYEALRTLYRAWVKTPTAILRD
ncbi:MAG: hypothetical protein KatS3mg043_0270 [Rhodothermaceae bacterium]|nr:MAG: hypothetical protein KatS3mg043_0270 [Rhodothermaceae bacterium]